MIDKENLIQFLKEKKLEDYSDVILKQLNETVKNALIGKLKEIKKTNEVIDLIQQLVLGFENDTLENLPKAELSN